MSGLANASNLSEKGKRLALVIGVNHAPNSLLPPLEHADADAEAMAEVLVKHCHFEMLELPLTGANATSDRVKDAVRRLARGRSDEDFLLLYFSGHGLPMTIEANQQDVYLITSNFNEIDVEEDENAHFSMRWLRDRFYLPTNAGRLLLILDCCYAGNYGRIAPDPYLEELKKRINYYFGAPGSESGAPSGGLRLALTSTGHNEIATEKDGHGIMTCLLQSALRGEVDSVLGNEGQITLNSLFDYLQSKMSPEQQPSLSGDFAGRSCILASYVERAAELRKKLSLRVANDHPTNYIPFPRNLLFQERPGEFDRLETLLFGPGTEQKTTRLGLVGVVGLGGVGKTQLAVELAYRCLDQHRFPSGIFWMPAAGTNVFEWQKQLAVLASNAGYLPLDDDVSHPENEMRRARYFCRYLASHKDALLILDNVEDPNLVISALPVLAGGDVACDVLYTSRNTFVPPGLVTYLVEELPEEEALRLLLETTRPLLLSEVLSGNQDVEVNAAREVCKGIGYLPLALVHLRGLLARDKNLTLVRLAEVLKQRGALELIKTQQDDANSLFEMFWLSWEKVRDEGARRLFKLASYFPVAAPIPLWLLGLAAGLGESGDIFEPLGEACIQLQELSLLEVLSGEQVRLHPLVREFGRRLVDADGSKGKVFMEEAGERLATEFMDLNKLENRALRVGYWRCLEQVRTAHVYAKLLETNQVEVLDLVERWLDRESYRLGDEQWWPKAVPGLFYQQLFNQSIEEGHPLKTHTISVPWLRLIQPVGSGSRTLLRLFVGHFGPVNSVAFSPDGTRVLTGSADRTARLWNATSGIVLATLRGHTDAVTSVAFSPDDTRVLTGSADRTARLWEATSGTRLATLRGHTDAVTSVAFSPDGTRVLTGSTDRTARLWDIANGTLLATLEGHTGAVTSVAFSPDGTRVLTGSADKTALLWDIANGPLLATLEDHTRAVTSVAFSPDGTKVLTGSADRTARLWEATSGMVFAILRGHAGMVNSVAFSPDGIRVLTGSIDQTARLWNATSGTVFTTLVGHTLGVTSVAFSSDGMTLLTGSIDQTARLWNLTSEMVPTAFEIQIGPVNSVAFSPDGTRVLTGSADKTARLWNATSGTQLAILKGHTGVVTSVAFSPDGTRVLTGSTDRTARFWNATSGMVLAILKGHTGVVTSVAFSPDGTRVLTGSTDRIARLWDIANGTLLATLEGHTRAVTSVAFSPDGTRVLTGSTDRTARLWNATSGTQLAILKGHTGVVTSVAFSPVGTRVLTGSADKTALLWDIANGTLLTTLEGHTRAVTSVAFSPDGTRVLTGSVDRTARLWEAAYGNVLVTSIGYGDAVKSEVLSPDTTRALITSADTSAMFEESHVSVLATLRRHKKGLTSVAFSPDGTRALTGSADRKARLWVVANGTLLATLRGHTGAVTSVAFSPDGTRVLTGSADRKARLWDIANGTLLVILEGHLEAVNSVAFSSDGTRVLTGSADKTARLWNATSGTQLATLRGHTGVVTSVAFSPDGTRVLTGSADKTARLWNATSGMVLATLKGHTGAVTSVAFSPDGTRVLTGSTDRTARLWDIANGRGLAILDGQAGLVRSVEFSPSGRFVITCNTHGRVLFWDSSETEVNHLLGFYPATYEVGALYWHKNTYIVLADKGGPRKRPHFYHLNFEGNW